jgi:hypothetical protein
MSDKRERELALFKLFLELQPEFSGERLARFSHPEDEKDFPDIEAKSVSGRSVGVEIGEWLNEDGMAAGKSKERREAPYLAAIGEQGERFTKNIEYIWIYARKSRIQDKDAVAFREQLFKCVAECDERWPRERYWAGGPMLKPADFASYPMLVKYLEAIKLYP